MLPSWRYVLLLVLTAVLPAAFSDSLSAQPPVTSPPAELKVPEFYSKYISASGYPIVASANVNDYALREAAYLVDCMLAQRPDVREAMIRSGSRMCIIAHNEFTTDLPEWEWMGNPRNDGREATGVSAKDFWDGRARGMGGSATDPYCSCSEENLLGYAGDPYSTECILIHEFAHNIHLRGMMNVDPTFDVRLKAAYESAISRGLWKGKYAAVNHYEYFAEGAQSWFDNNRENDHDHNHVNTRAELLEYDPALAELCREVFRNTVLSYTKPVTRLNGHLLGYDPEEAPQFVWPPRVALARESAIRMAQARSDAAAKPAETAETATDRSLLTIDRLFASDEFNEQNFGSIVWANSGSDCWLLEQAADGSGRQIVRYDIVGDARTIPVNAGQLTPEGRRQPLSVASFEFSSDESRLLIFTNTQRVWRQNTRGDYWLLDLNTKSLRQLGGSNSEPASMMFAKFSPDGSRIVFVRQNNIYVQDCATLEVTPITVDGSASVINGTSDWVYEEELGVRDGVHWSPDGRSLAFWQLDTSGVREFYLINNTDDLYSRPIPIPYPKVGQQNASGRIGVVALEHGPGDREPGSNGFEPGAVQWLNLPGDPRNHYVAQLEWIPDSRQLILQQFNRLQNTNTVFTADVSTGEVQPILVEEDSAWLENENPFRWLDGGPAGPEFLWVSERSGWRSLYRARVGENSRLTRLVEDDFDVIAEEAIDESGGWLYFAASPENATQRYLYRVPLSGGKAERITPADQPGWHTYQFSADRRFAVHSYSAFTAPPRSELVRMPEHTVVRTLTDNTKLSRTLAQLDQPEVKFTQLDIGDDVQLDAWYMLPPGFDSAKKYPLLLHVYGEPHGQTVRDMWFGKRGLWHQMLAQQGFIVASIDNRGTMSPRGRQWRKIVHRQIGILASADQAAATRELLRLLPAADPARVGIWGWSGGGSMSLNAIFRYPDLYKTAIAVAPVPDQLLYDTIYQERYMGLPADNVEGYRLGSPITFAEQLKGDLLLIHGTGDDNCHYQGVERLMNELIRHNKHFSVLPYPNRTHAISEGTNTTRHLYESMTRYLRQHLLQ